MSLSPRPDPTVRFTNSEIVRSEYLAECSGIHLVKNSRKLGLVLNFMEGTPSPTPLPPLTEGWRAIALDLSPEDARAFGNELIRLADEATATER